MAKQNGGGAPRQVGISSTQVKKFHDDLSSKKQRLDDVTMSHAEGWKKFEEAGGNKAAMKAVMKLTKQDTAKTADFQCHFDFYADTLGLRAQLDAFDERQADEESHVEAAKHNEKQPQPEPVH